MRCPGCGRYRATNRTQVVACKCGARYVLAASVKPPVRFGQAFRKRNADLFLKPKRGKCRCREALMLLDRWGKDKSLERVDMLAKLMNCTADELAVALRAYAD